MLRFFPVETVTNENYCLSWASLRCTRWDPFTWIYFMAITKYYLSISQQLTFCHVISILKRFDTLNSQNPIFNSFHVIFVSKWGQPKDLKQFVWSIKLVNPFCFDIWAKIPVLANFMFSKDQNIYRHTNWLTIGIEALSLMLKTTQKYAEEKKMLVLICKFLKFFHRPSVEFHRNSLGEL